MISSGPNAVLVDNKVMRVATYFNNHDIRIEEREVPKIGEGELLLQVRASGICGSDVAEWYRTKKVGRVLGHEVAGDIAEVGAGLKQYKVGERMAASHHVPCYRCHYCQLGHHTLCDTIHATNFDPGGFAEYLRLPAINVQYGVYKLPDSVSYEEGTFIEPVACTLRAQRKANISPEKTVLVIGCGVSGLLHLLVARAFDRQRLIATDLNPNRLEIAKKCGADVVFLATEDLLTAIPKVNEGRLADIVILCTGSTKATEQALRLVDRGGTLLFFALNAPEQLLSLPLYDLFWKRGVILMNSYAATPEEQREALTLLRDGKVSVQKLISHRLAFGEIGKGFSMVAAAKDSLKVIVDPTR